MRWKQIPYWIRGGIIALIVPIFLITILLLAKENLLDFVLNPDILEPIWVTLITSPNTPAIWLNIFAFWFIIGAMIGEIYSKIKKKNKK